MVDANAVVKVGWTPEARAEIQSLRAEIERLTSQVAALQATQGRKVLPPPTEPAVRIAHRIVANSFVMPSDELDQLATIVLEKYSQLGDIAGPAFHGSKQEREEDWWSKFDAAFLALGNFRRTEAPNTKRYISHWMEESEI